MDGTSMKGKYTGCLLAATGRNGNNDVRVALCVYTPTPYDFKKRIEDFKKVGGRAAIEFLDGAPYKNWANAFFKGHRYGSVSSSVAESFNSWLGDSRSLPITSMLDVVRVNLMKMMS
ncbi:hypothetical protein BVC80_1763g24 [Macleaya cordata]|uniref:Uncharacterized protein n=1 Tax=Macleaya cordata TaxID=56857 RepID=A0A200QT91_MACCD|nr:hypothetical protein BVC80_1763g24 [Macleaya cordata]